MGRVVALWIFVSSAPACSGVSIAQGERAEPSGFGYGNRHLRALRACHRRLQNRELDPEQLQQSRIRPRSFAHGYLFLDVVALKRYGVGPQRAVLPPWGTDGFTGKAHDLGKRGPANQNTPRRVNVSGCGVAEQRLDRF